jgi:hypothetical protein
MNRLPLHPNLARAQRFLQAAISKLAMQENQQENLQKNFSRFAIGPHAVSPDINGHEVAS